MDDKTRAYINGLKLEEIPWHRFLTDCGTAYEFVDALANMDATDDADDWEDDLTIIEAFENQGTLFSPAAPYSLVFLVRMLDKRLSSGNNTDNAIAEKLVEFLSYCAEVCADAEKLEHAEPPAEFADMLDEEYLLPDDCNEDGLEEIIEETFEDSDAIPDSLYYGFYYYSGKVLSQVPDILDKYGKFVGESKKIRKILS